MNYASNCKLLKPQVFRLFLVPFPPEAMLKSQISLQRLAQPKEIAAAIAFLVSDDASYISGSTLAVDGRWL